MDSLHDYGGRCQAAEGVEDGPGSLAGGPPRQRGRREAAEGRRAAAGLVVRSINGRDAVIDRETGEILRLEEPKPEASAEVAVYARDVRVRRKITHSRAVNSGGGSRGKIIRLTRQAKRNMLHHARNVEGLTVMITLTYPGEYPTDGRKTKRDWSALRHWLTRRGLAGFWWLEYQERGAPHIHCFLSGRVEKQELAEAWFRIVASGDERHLRAGTRVEAVRQPHALAAYAAKYAAKMEQKEVPAEYTEVGRFWGLFGGLKVQPKQVVAGTRRQVAAVVRVVRSLRTAQRRELGLRQLRDNGRSGFSLYGLAPAILAYLGVVQPQEVSRE